MRLMQTLTFCLAGAAALAVVLALTFWTWLWGPLGTFLATPILITIAVVQQHTMPADEVELPD